MDRANYFNGQRVTSDDLNYTETSKATHMQQELAALAGRIIHPVSASVPSNFQQLTADASGPTAFAANGVLGGYGSVHLAPVTGSLTQISINRGWAVTEGMDLIALASSVTINKNDNTFNNVWTDTTSGPMYVVAEYIEASGSVQADVNGNPQYTRYTPSYRIHVTATVPTASNQVLLAQFTGNAGAITAGTFQDMRTWFRPWSMAESTIIKTPAVSGISTSEQHQAAVGHAQPTSINPHGLSLADLGGIPPFVNGIYIMDNLSATIQSYSGSVAPASQINFTVPSHATASVANNTYTNALSPLSALTTSDGTYYVVAIPSGTSLAPQFVSTGSITYDPLQPELNPSLLFLGKAVVSSNAVASYTDLRDFYVQSPAFIRSDLVESASNPATALRSYNTLTDSLNRLRYQIGVALNGTGSASSWKGPNPLTSGPASSADAYHNHPQYLSSTTFNNEFSTSSGSIHIDTSPYGNHVYTNNTGKTAFVSITLQMDFTASPGTGEVDLMVDNNVLPTTTIAAVAKTDTGQITTFTLTGFVPNGKNFRFKSVGTGGTVITDQFGAMYW